VEDVTRALDRSRWEVGTIITFDEAGVSGHSNHISCYRGALAYRERLKGAGTYTYVYALETVPLMRKYLGSLDAQLETWTNWRGRDGVVLVEQSERGRKAMIDAHRSQMVWFRYGWIWLSRYMYANTLRLVS